jgi:hypothetical protein
VDVRDDDLRRLFEFARTEAAFNGAMKAGQRVVVNDAVAHPKEAIVLGRIPTAIPRCWPTRSWGWRTT